MNVWSDSSSKSEALMAYAAKLGKHVIEKESTSSSSNNHDDTSLANAKPTMETFGVPLCGDDGNPTWAINR